jgi:hypothetical protein
MEKLKHYVIYNPDDYEEYTVCLEHPTSDIFSLCGGRIDETPDGQPYETYEKINCKFCLETIKAIKELKDV